MMNASFKYLLHLVLCLGLAGCAFGPPRTNAIKSEIYGLSNAGLVVGRISSVGQYGVGIYFKNTATGEAVLYKGAKDFSLWLPEGNYALDRIGSRKGSLGAYKTPLAFHVEKGRVVYVGTISYGCVQQSKIVKWYGVQFCGFLALSDHCTVASADIPMCILDEQDQTIKSFREELPDFSSAPITSSIMR